MTAAPVVAPVSEVESRVPPHDPDAEAAVISAVIFDPEALPKIAHLKPEHFYAEAHRRIFEACVDLADRSTPIDTVTVATWLRDRGRLAQVGGMAYVTQVLNSAPAVEHVQAYAAIVDRKWRARQALYIAQRVQALTYSGADVDAVLAPAVAELTDLAKPAGPSSALRLVTGAELWKPLDPPDYVLEPVFVRGSLGLVVAYGASLKTWIVLDGGLSVATGEAWLLRFATKQGRALLVDFESGEYELRRRLHKLARGRGWPVPVDGLSFVSMPQYSLVDDAFFDALRTLAEGHAFIGIDSLAAGSGGVDENDARFATSLNRLKAIASDSGCVIVVLHHSRKGNGEDGDEREMVRGSSAIFNACDVVLQLRRFNDSGAFVLKQTKARGGKSIEPLVVRVEDTEEGGAVVSGTDLESAADDGDAQAATRSIEKAKRQIIMLLGTERGLGSKNAIYRRIGGTKTTKIGALDELLESRVVTLQGEAYALASGVAQ